MEDDTLDFIEKEQLKIQTMIFQARDGTILYYERMLPARVYYNCEGVAKETKLPDGLEYRGSSGDAIFFAKEKKIYQAIYTALDVIAFSVLRDELKGETVHAGGLCSRYRNGRMSIYRLHEDPETWKSAGIHVKLTEEQHADLMLIGVHRGKAVFISRKSTITEPSVAMMGDNAIVVTSTLSLFKSYFPSDSCSFLYFSCGLNLHTFDTDRMIFLPSLRIDGVHNIAGIIGVHNGIITVDSENKREDASFFWASAMKRGTCLMTAQLPIGHVHQIEKVSTSDIGDEETDPIVPCASCNEVCSPISLRLCIKEDCSMYNQLLCLSCVVDGGHGSHVVKHDIKLAMIRNELRVEVAEMCSQVEQKKIILLEKTKQLLSIAKATEKTIAEVHIPPKMIDMMDSVTSRKDASEIKRVINEQVKTISCDCDSLTKGFDFALESAKGLYLFNLFENRDDKIEESDDHQEKYSVVLQLHDTIRDLRQQISALRQEKVPTNQDGHYQDDLPTPPPQAQTFAFPSDGSVDGTSRKKLVEPSGFRPPPPPPLPPFLLSPIVRPPLASGTATTPTPNAAIPNPLVELQAALEKRNSRSSTVTAPLPSDFILVPLPPPPPSSAQTLLTPSADPSSSAPQSVTSTAAAPKEDRPNLFAEIQAACAKRKNRLSTVAASTPADLIESPLPSSHPPVPSANDDVATILRRSMDQRFEHVNGGPEEAEEDNDTETNSWDEIES